MTTEKQTPDLIADHLDQAFGDGPGHRPVEDRLTAGRRVVRRRRGAAGASVLAVATVVTAVALTTGGGGAGRAADPATTSGTTSTSPTPSPSPQVGDVADPSQPVQYDPFGNIVFRGDVEVIRREVDPLQLQAPATSDAVELRYPDGSVHYWLLTFGEDGGTSSTSDPAGKAFGTFAEWLADQLSEPGGAPTDDLVVLTPAGELVAGEGAQILEQRSPVDLGPDFAPADATTAAALVERDGVRWWVLVRQFPGERAEYFPASYRVGGPSMETFLEHARAQYAGGEGLK